MPCLRSRERKVLSGFSVAEIERMEALLKELGEKSLEDRFCRKIGEYFNSSGGRAGKPIVKWTEVQSWFRSRQQNDLQKDTSPNSLKRMFVTLETCPLDTANGRAKISKISKGEKIPDLSELEFEARSSTDRAWYDVDVFIDHKFLSSGEAEVLVRYIGFEEDENEWVNTKAVRLRSIPLEHSECENVNVGDIVLCFQERRDEARHYDARILEIERKLHDIRGCRCLFLIQYVHDNSEEKVCGRRLCCHPTY